MSEDDRIRSRRLEEAVLSAFRSREAPRPSERFEEKVLRAVSHIELSTAEPEQRYFERVLLRAAAGSGVLALVVLLIAASSGATSGIEMLLIDDLQVYTLM